MENNLDDILVDNPENNENKSAESKRKILIGVASGLLVGVVVLVAYFVFAKKDQPQGLEVTHDELERFVNPPKDVAIEFQSESKPKDDFDRLIDEIKSKQNANETQTQPQIRQVDSVQKLAKSEVAEESQELVKSSVEPANQPQEQALNRVELLQEDRPVQKEIKSLEKSIQSPQKTEAKPTSKPQNKSDQSVKQTDKQTKVTTKGSNTLGARIPKGFYLQVGVFSGKPNVDFLNKIAQFSYKVERLNRNGKVVNRYLIGGFKSRNEAESKINEVTQKINKPIVVEIH